MINSYYQKCENFQEKTKTYPPNWKFPGHKPLIWDLIWYDQTYPLFFQNKFEMFACTIP